MTLNQAWCMTLNQAWCMTPNEGNHSPGILQLKVV